MRMDDNLIILAAGASSRMKQQMSTNISLSNEELQQANKRSKALIAIDASGLFSYQGGVFTGPCSRAPADVDPAVVIVGYGEILGKKYYRVANSWGSSWGDMGYFYLERGSNLCGVANYGVVVEV